VVIFCVAYRDCVVRREPKNVQGVPEASTLADRLLEHHEAPSVEEDYERQLQLSDGGKDCWRCASVCLDNALAGSEGDSPSLQFVEKGLRRKTTEDACLTGGKREDGTILGDYRIDETEISAETPEVREDSTSCDDNNDAASTGFGDGRLDPRGRQTVLCNRPIIIECEHTEFHRSPAGHAVTITLALDG
jgi:hypothetical protein